MPKKKRPKRLRVLVSFTPTEWHNLGIYQEKHGIKKKAAAVRNGFVRALQLDFHTWRIVGL